MPQFSRWSLIAGRIPKEIEKYWNTRYSTSQWLPRRCSMAISSKGPGNFEGTLQKFVVYDLLVFFVLSSVFFLMLAVIELFYCGGDSLVILFALFTHSHYEVFFLLHTHPAWRFALFFLENSNITYSAIEGNYSD